jgi:hypothetical protein
MAVKFEPRLEAFIAYLEAEVRQRYSGLAEEYYDYHELEFSREGAAMVLAWFGLADLDEDFDGDGDLMWHACGRLTSPRVFKD